MTFPYDYAVIGGDLRQVYLAEKLANKENRVCHYALCAPLDARRCTGLSSVTAMDSPEEICRISACIICPIPFCKKGTFLNQSVLDKDLPVNQLLSDLHSGQYFFGGCIPEDFKTAAREKGVRVFDLMEISSLALFNSIATAEGAICEAIKRSPLNLHQSSCAILGYGKCGRTLACYLKGMFCRLYAAARKERDRAEAALLGARTGSLEDFETCAGEFDFIFNTIPSTVITSDILAKLKSTVTIIDIASAPGGVDFASAEKLGVNAVLCPGLPGKYAPASSAGAIKETIENILKEDSKCL
ncbi:MAG: dipicolinate synthase subunit DpsA [Lachnospiraceae bacterium]|nr:dipicolinate synthase subunit DpsA [Lachnospiraceae bacterium]